ncbi:ceramide kinase isoform X2 [Rhodamnia argentea]|uniref:Ceramide kinase isoform X2 n=1 Tax=Rhodamnia argentea TaxID=178133 RepID=A0A8B8PI10_9MYRT|nr:ceramide kinase isoform X2 [Rhodamnia argentea]
MESNGDDSILRDEAVASSNAGIAGETSVVSANLILDRVGEVALALDLDGLSWKLLERLPSDRSDCCGVKRSPSEAAGIRLADIYAVEFIDHALIPESNLSNPARCLLREDSQIYRFIVHGVERSKCHPCRCILGTYVFGHKDQQVCQMWVNVINSCLDQELQRPKNLLVFVHPKSGKGNGRTTWETVSPIFSRAKVHTKVIVTERAGHAFDVMLATTNEELKQYDGVVAVGGDGFFNEILNGFLSSRHKAPYPPAPTDFVQSLGDCGDVLMRNTNIRGGEGHSGTCYTDDTQFLLPKEEFRFGIIPAGSTDAIVICTTGARDPVTSALQIVMGKNVPLDIAQIVRWRTTAESKVEPCVRYAASFAGYGFYGDVITESEKYRWMGPKRYDYAGTKVFLRHRSYEAEVAVLRVNSEETHPAEEGHWRRHFRALRSLNKRQKVICRANCEICTANRDVSSQSKPYSHPGEMGWLSFKGRYLSVGAAIIACRNGRAPDGLVADAHLADGFMHLILIKDCPRAFYLGHLLQLAKRDGDPLNFEFVEHHKTSAFTFRSSGKSSIWNLDGELFQAHQLSAQVFRGLINLFASGPLV